MVGWEKSEIFMWYCEVELRYRIVEFWVKRGEFVVRLGFVGIFGGGELEKWKILI